MGELDTTIKSLVNPARQVQMLTRRDWYWNLHDDEAVIWPGKTDVRHVFPIIKQTLFALLCNRY